MSVIITYRENKLTVEEEQKSKDLVNELFNEMMDTFNEYRITPSFFGPLQVVDYDGIGGNFVENLDDAEFQVKTRSNTRSLEREKQIDIKELRKEVPSIVNYYKDQ